MKQLLLLLLFGFDVHAIELGEYKCANINEEIAAEEGSFKVTITTDNVVVYYEGEESYSATYFIADQSVESTRELSEDDKRVGLIYYKYKLYRVDESFVLKGRQLYAEDQVESTFSADLIKLSQDQIKMISKYFTGEEVYVNEDLCTKEVFLSS